ncbi:DUF7344 domain-containing protein [Haloarchaeobius sp. HRN-SO-5]|uniref:DUF7344 domain-containing protein n=1 Tax=Haloarchaeobius sp. HRN-SO-5 TaxID=3446118 RepID=UPI003EB7F7E0
MGTEKQSTTVPKHRSEDDAAGPSKGELFEALSNRRRRETLRYLLEQDDEATTKGEVARHIAARETGKDVDDVSSSERKRVYIALHQTHLPKLDDVGLVDYDSSQGDLSLGDGVDGLDVYLDVAADDDAGCWGAYYAGLGGVGLALTTLAGTGVVPVGPDLALGLVAAFTTAVAATGVAQVYANVTGSGPDDLLDTTPDGD